VGKNRGIPVIAMKFFQYVNGHSGYAYIGGGPDTRCIVQNQGGGPDVRCVVQDQGGG
jgi:hypothetical protein